MDIMYIVFVYKYKLEVTGRHFYLRKGRFLVSNDWILLMIKLFV